MTGRTVRIGTANNGQTLCVSRGATVEVVLKGNARQWAGITAQGGALTRETGKSSNGQAAVVAFSAVRTGTATLTSSARVCPTPDGQKGMSPGGPGCDAMLEFRVTVVVSG